MLQSRIIPCLLLQHNGLVKGKQFADHRYIGDPINAVQILSTMEVDELLFLDITATDEHRLPPQKLIQKIADQCLMPFGIGGGIKSVTDAKTLLQSGAEKVCLNTAAFENPDLVTQIASTFGRQSLIVSIDYRTPSPGNYHVYTHHGSQRSRLSLYESIALMENAGAGEIMLNSIDRDGMMIGLDLDTATRVSQTSHVPIIVSGGAGSYQDLAKVLDIPNINAVAAGSLFVYHGPRHAVLINYPDSAQLKTIKS